MKLENSEVWQRFQGLSPREKLLTIGGAVVVLVYGAYGLFYEPLAADTLLLRQKIQSQRQVYQYLQQLSHEVSSLRRQGVGRQPADGGDGQSPLAIIDNSSQQLAIKPAIKRLLPEGEDKVTVWLEDVAFDELISWLAILESKHGLSVIQADVEPAADLGLVKARILLGGQA